MGSREVDVVVIGAGHAGLAASYYLTKNKINHLVFERGRIGETWISQRWDTFVVNTPNKYNVIFKDLDPGNNPDGFETAKEYVAYLNSCCDKFHLPVIENAKVISIEKINGEQQFIISVQENGITKDYKSRQVIVASGCMNVKKIPACADKISPRILQLHTCEYRSSSQLPEGNVLVVGSAQSGCQIAEDLADAGRKVFLSTSKVGRFPRRYRGKDVVDWLVMTGFLNMKTEDVTDPAMLTTKVPVVSGIGPLGHTLSYQLLAKRGVTILGRMKNADGENMYLDSNAAEHVKFGDEFSNNVKSMVDEFISKNQLTAPAPEQDIADEPDADATCVTTITSLNLKEHNITSIIWSTGFYGDFSYLKIGDFDDEGIPKHNHGLSNIDGLYFLGLPWLRSRKSANLIGINDDVIFITETVARKIPFTVR